QEREERVESALLALRLGGCCRGQECGELCAGHRLDLFLARGRAGHQLQVTAEALGRIRDEHPRHPTAAYSMAGVSRGCVQGYFESYWNLETGPKAIRFGE